MRDRLGIPAGKQVVLYAPTWRDDHHIAHGKRGFSLRLDLARAREALGGDHVFLVRTHYLISDRTWSEMDDVVIDVSSYPDITDLYLAADVLVTDYSSAMFDFAGTGKPMVFFTYDLERYRDHVRGFYFDFGAEAPGPLLRTSEEVVARGTRHRRRTRALRRRVRGVHREVLPVRRRRRGRPGSIDHVIGRAADGAGQDSSAAISRALARSAGYGLSNST